MNDSSTLTLTNCEFKSNVAGSSGGGMYNDEHSVLALADCVFTNNEASWGGGMSNRDSVVMLWNCVLTNNKVSYGDGGGIHNWYVTNLTLSGCRIVSNMAANGGGISSFEGGEAGVDNCLFIGNVAYDENGGAMCNTGETELTVSNCTIAGNKAVNGNALACELHYGDRPGNVEFTNCILWDSGDEIWNNDGSIISVSYSDIQGGWSGLGNIDADPCFADPGYWNPNGTLEDTNDDFWIDGDYHLKSQAGRWDPNSQSWVLDEVMSPCIDAGDPASPIGDEPFPNGGRINMGAYGGTAEASKSYFGEPPCEVIVAGDINGDCAVNFKDFMLMARHWLEEHDG